MTDLRTAAQQALERLRKYHYGNGFAEDAECIADLEAALAQQAEPVAGCETEADCTSQPWCRIRGECQRKQAEPAQEPITRLFGTLPVHDTQQALAQQAEPVQPFGYWFPDKHQDAVCSGWFVRSPCDGKLDGKPGVPLYTAPPQRKPLPKHDQHCVDVPGYGLMAVRLVRAVERAHGIKE